MNKYFLAVLWVLLSHAVANPTLAILDVQLEGFADKQIATPLQQNIIDAAQSWADYPVMPLAEYQNKALNSGLMIPTSCDASCYSSAGKKLGVDWVLQVKAIKASPGVELLFNLYNVSSQTLVQTAHLPAGTALGSMIQGGLNEVFSPMAHFKKPSMPTHQKIALGIGTTMAAAAVVLWATSGESTPQKANNYYQVTTPFAVTGP